MSKRSLAWTLALVLGLVVAPGSAGAAPPAAATLSTATGTQALTFTWNVVAGATWYYLWVNDDDAAPKFTRWYTAEEVGCAGAGTLCSVTVALSWRPGAGRWWIRSNNADGNGPWSAYQNFTIPQARPFRVVDSSVPAKEVGIVFAGQEVMRRVNGIPVALRFVYPHAIVFEDVISFWHEGTTCSGATYTGAYLPRRLWLMGPTFATAFLSGTDVVLRTFGSYTPYVGGVAQPCVMAPSSFLSTSITAVDATSDMGSFVPPFVVLP